MMNSLAASKLSGTIHHKETVVCPGLFHNTLEAIGESHPDRAILDHTHFGNSPVSRHHQ
jgi:hypothetical protein